jgi:DNA-directed RNA polymerase specialized sigma24 family protein
LTDPALTATLSQFVRARVPASEVDDIVQSTLADAIASENAPENDEEIPRWVQGICRHKVVDWFRRMRREVPRDLEVEDVAAGGEGAQGDGAHQAAAHDLLRWAERELPAGEEHARTLEWMLREGDGEKLETIAEEENVPAPRVRQRVSRMRKHFRARHAAQLAALAALLAIAVGLFFALRGKREVVAPKPDPSMENSAQPAPGPAPSFAPPQVPPSRPAESVDSVQPSPPSVPPLPTTAPGPVFSPDSMDLKEGPPVKAPTKRAPKPMAKPAPKARPMGKAASDFTPAPASSFGGTGSSL